MPLYEYQCTNCGESCELLQKVNEEPAVTCPNCGKDQLKKQVSASSFQLKGSGWYVTDFKNKDKPVKTEANPSSEPASSSTTSETTKPETKTNTDKDS